MLRSELNRLYKCVNYHLKEYSTHGPENVEEIFNYCHFSLRNVIERTFGMLKKQFPIISRIIEPFFPIDIVLRLLLSSCILYNCLMGVDPNKKLIVEVDRELLNSDILNESRNNTNDNDVDDKR